jgi:alpha-D-ribose 1-methylphosphonate 5-triphosphate synthase subunit PhnI
MMKVIFSDHAKLEMERRQIDKSLAESVVNDPQQELSSGKDRIILQSKYLNRREHKELLLRIIGRRIESGFFVLTAYKTSKIAKYWKKED